MKSENNQKGSTRRSFMKKGVVAAMATGSYTILTGLVNADPDFEPYDPYVGDECIMVRDSGPRGVCMGRIHPAAPNRIEKNACWVHCVPGREGKSNGFLAVCTPNGIPVNNGFFGPSEGCKSYGSKGDHG
ncbi:MAG: hypothetical protein ABF328_05235 [Akkermansiaceae bacterium]